jgi:hypothetical protein
MTNLVKVAMFIRMTVTVISLYILKLYSKIGHNIYLILAIILTLLDGVDSVFIKNKKNLKSYCYQSSDKIYDCISYLLIFLFFKIDNSLLVFFVLYRIIGVILFTKTKNSVWLIVFFDFVKEYLLYFYIFGNNNTYLPIFISCKILFEYYFHTYINPNNYQIKGG